jgi:hypothetical protein
MFELRSLQGCREVMPYQTPDVVIDTRKKS